MNKLFFQGSKNRFWHMGAFLSLVAIFAVLIVPRVQRTYADTASGVVFNDYNGDGAQGANELGVAGVMVTAYAADGSEVAQTTTAANGSYSLTNIPNGTQVRLEFSDFPLGYEPGPAGPSSDTTVQFANSNTTTATLGLNRPANYCQDNPTLVTSCYIYGGGDANGPGGGEQYAPSRAAVVSFPNTAGTTSRTDNAGVGDPTTHDIMRPYSEVGTVWGLAYQRQSSTIFTSAFTKRHTRLGPGGTGAIYGIPVDAAGNGGPATLFLDLNTLFGSNVAGANPHPGDNNYFDDAAAIDAVGKNSIGDIDISEDEQTLWVINLHDRQLYEIPVGIPATAPTNPSQVTVHALPDPGTGAAGCPLDGTTPAGELNLNLRPGALKVADNRVYVGLTCTAESTQQASDLHAFVFAFDPATTTWDQVAEFPLDYPRGYASVDRTNPSNPVGLLADWRPWPNAATYSSGSFPAPGPYDQQAGYPQPWLIDIEFDERGAMIVGFADRFGHQAGNNNVAVGPVEGVSAGDMLRLAPAATPNTWELENNGSSGGLTTGGAGNGQGPGGGEFFNEERFQLPNPGGTTHDELSLGALAYILGGGQVISNMFDPPPISNSSGINGVRTGGIGWYARDTGVRERSYMLYAFDDPLTFGKASGVGDVEPLCQAAPIEIGNRVFFDGTGENGTPNGLQDPMMNNPSSTNSGDWPFAGVIVELYDADGNLVATTTTDANGNYLFTNANVPGGLQYNTTYEIRIPLDQTTIIIVDGQPQTVPLFANMVPTTPNAAGTNDSNDSDGTSNPTYVSTTLNTGGPGQNNHTYDFGFQPAAPTAVDIISFIAESETDRVTVRWTTINEEALAGFHIYRATSDNRDVAVRVNDTIIPARGFSSAYSWVDNDVLRGQQYYYWLQSVDIDGTTSERGPTQAQLPIAVDRENSYVPVLRR